MSLSYMEFSSKLAELVYFSYQQNCGRINNFTKSGFTSILALLRLHFTTVSKKAKSDFNLHQSLDSFYSYTF